MQASYSNVQVCELKIRKCDYSRVATFKQWFFFCFCFLLMFCLLFLADHALLLNSGVIML